MIRTVIIERWSQYRRWLPSDVYLWAKALLLTGVTIQAVRLLWVLVTPVGPLGDWMPASARALSPQLQMSVLAAVDPFVRGTPLVVAAAAPVVNVTLYGTRAEGGLGGGAAIIGLPDGTQKSFVVGEEVSPGVTLAAVHFDHVLLSSGGQQEQKLFLFGTEGENTGGSVYTTLPGLATNAKPSTAAAAGSTAALTAASIKQAVGFSPRSREGRVSGIIVSPGPDAVQFATAGFRPGDVIVAVNGARIASAIDVAQLQSNLVPGARLMLTVERGAETVPIALNLAGS